MKFKAWKQIVVPIGGKVFVFVSNLNYSSPEVVQSWTCNKSNVNIPFYPTLNKKNTLINHSSIHQKERNEINFHIHEVHSNEPIKLRTSMYWKFILLAQINLNIKFMCLTNCTIKIYSRILFMRLELGNIMTFIRI